MANVFNTTPMALDTDFTSYQANQSRTNPATPLGIKVRRYALVATGTTVAGAVNVVDAANGNNLLVPMNVAAGQAAGTVLFSAELTHPPNWKDFKVTGLTSTLTRLYIWSTL